MIPGGLYDRVAPLGSGAFATVWLARHRLTGMQVAIKDILRSSLDTPDAVTRFTREVSILSRLRHPFIAELFEVIETEDGYHLVMEYAEHGCILDFVNENGPLQEDRARRYFCELVSALDYLHNSQFVAHRDLKAENVLLDRNDNIRLIDFGLSNCFTKGTPTLVTACGSPAYCAPEMIRGELYTKAADIWSAGVLLYAMVAGTLPYNSDSVPDLLQKIVLEDIDYPQVMSRSLVDLLRRMLTKDPAGRVTIDRLKEHPWFSQCEYAVLVGFQIDKADIDRDIIEAMSRVGIDCRDLPIALLSAQSTSETVIYKQMKRDKVTSRMVDLVEEIKKMQHSETPARRVLTSKVDHSAKFARRTSVQLTRRFGSAKSPGLGGGDGDADEAVVRPTAARREVPRIGQKRPSFDV
jgi:serine/threonine protein kinase